jgi:hypothetical protein
MILTQLNQALTPIWSDRPLDRCHLLLSILFEISYFDMEEIPCCKCFKFWSSIFLYNQCNI